MSKCTYYPDTCGPAVGVEQAEQVTSTGHEPAGMSYGAGGAAWGGGSDNSAVAVLPRVTANVLNGAGPQQFQTDIDTGRRQLGNRAFLRWVERLLAEEHYSDVHEVMAGGLHGTGHPLIYPETQKVGTGPAQATALPAHTYAPLQLQKKKDKKDNGARPEDVSGHGMAAREEASREMTGPAANTESSLAAGISMEFQQLEADLADLTRKLAVFAEELELPKPAGDNMTNQDPEYGEMGVEQAGAPVIEATGSTDEIAGPEPDTADEAGGLMARYLTYFFPAVSYLYNLLKERAGHVQTAEHDALSLPGIGNTLATVMLGLLMIGAGLPLDIFTNLLGGMARCIMLLSDIFFGKPAEWLLKLYFKYYPPSAADRARSTSDDLPRGPPRGIDWNVSIPELIAISGISAYWQAGVSQSSLSPRRWIQPWTGGRVASIICRTLVNDIVYLLQFTVFPQVSRRILQNRLRWSETRSGLFVSVLNNIFDVVSTYILSYLTNMPLAVYLVFQDLIENNDLTSSQAAAAVIGYAALGMFIQTVSEAVYEYFVVTRVNERNLVPWLNQFRTIPNRLVRTMAIALASFRNVIINVLSISLTTGQLSANIIGPLSTRFGQGGACFWPLAVAEVCGKLPAGFNQTAQDEIIAAGEENLSFGQLFAIQMSPWLVGLLGLGVPVAYVLIQYRRARRRGRRTDIHRPDEIGPGQQADAGMTESGIPVDSVTSSIPGGGSELSVEVHENQSRPPVSDVSVTNPLAEHMTAQMLVEFLIRLDSLAPAELGRILGEHIDSGDITEEEATLIAEMVLSMDSRENQSQPPVSDVPITNPLAEHMTAQMLVELLVRQDRLTPARLREILERQVADGSITAGEAELIEAIVREEVVLAKERR